jgi:signal transduction histidine kinase
VAEAIIGESQRLVDMLEELSVYASGAQRTMKRQPLPLDELVRQVAAHESRESAESGLVVDTSRLEPAVVLADIYYLRQAIDNLVRNAAEAMEGREGSRLALSVGREGASAVVRVSDNGPGIAPEKLEQVFQPFVSTKGKGMGLGLAICREIAESHAGRLDVESMVGQGTTFTLRIPLHGDGLSTGALPGMAPEPNEVGAWS